MARKGTVSSKIANNSNEYETGNLITHSTKRTKQPQHKTHENNEAILESGPEKEALCSPLNVVMRKSTILNQRSIIGKKVIVISYILSPRFSLRHSKKKTVKVGTEQISKRCI